MDFGNLGYFLSYWATQPICLEQRSKESARMCTHFVSLLRSIPLFGVGVASDEMVLPSIEVRQQTLLPPLHATTVGRQLFLLQKFDTGILSNLCIFILRHKSTSPPGQGAARSSGRIPK
jgi:hypothetical protein